MLKATVVNGDKYRNAPPYLVKRILAAPREVTLTGCWLWPTTSHDGYGYAKYRSKGRRLGVYVHRLVYMHLVADPGDDLELDHLCHDPDACSGECLHRRCYNPAHLEPVTAAENKMRSIGSFCLNGHRMTPENTYTYPDGSHHDCRECHCARAAEWKAANADEVRAVRRAKATAKLAASVRDCMFCGADIRHRGNRAMACETCRPPKRTPKPNGRWRPELHTHQTPDHVDNTL